MYQHLRVVITNTGLLDETDYIIGLFSLSAAKATRKVSPGCLKTPTMYVYGARPDMQRSDS